jgi:hypothetical protein
MPKVRIQTSPGHYRLVDGLTVDLGAGGLGDALLGLTATSHLKAERQGLRVEYGIGGFAVPFVELFDGYDALGPNAKSHSEAPVEGAVQMNLGYTAEAQSKMQVPRWQRYADNIGAAGNRLPNLRDPAKIRGLGADYAGYVALCPFSTDRCREWAVPSWLDLEARLHAAGYQTVVLHSDAGPCKPFKSRCVIGETAGRVAGVILNAVCVVGTDSGLAHLSAVMGVPTVVLGGSTPVQQIFGVYPAARCLQGTLSCSGCCGGSPCDERCKASCANVQTLTPARVLQEVDSVFLKCDLTAGKTLVDTSRLAVIRDMLLSTASLAGDVAELGVYRGGVAKLLRHFAPASTLRLFDTFAGIPETDALPGGHQKGDFADTSLDAVREYVGTVNTEYHVGIFPGTAPPEASYRFAHIDGDTYQTTLAALDYFLPRMVPGGVLVFDDYAWHMCPGVAKALHERVEGRIERLAPFQAVVR